MNDEHVERDPDFIDRTLESFDHVLDIFHDKVLRPILMVGRFVAYGLIIVLAAVVLVIALVIGLLRLLNVYVFVGHVWISYLAIGAIFVVAGLVIWRRRRPVPIRKS